MRSISRVVDVSINTVTKLLVEAGEACANLHDAQVQDVKASKIQCDEIWSFVGTKQKNVATAKGEPEGDVWTWTAIDADTKLIVSPFVGDRSGQSAIALMDDLRDRLANRVQLTTDGHKAYMKAVKGALAAMLTMRSSSRCTALRPRQRGFTAPPNAPGLRKSA
jgi:IS1 family transposase